MLTKKTRMKKTTAHTTAAPDPVKWAARIDRIADPDLRNVVACIVWWDLFGSLPFGNRHPSFAGYLAGWRPDYVADVRAVRRELIRLGYEPEDADKKAARTKPVPKTKQLTRGGHYE